MHTWASQHTGSPPSAPTGADSEPGIAWGVSVEGVFIANRQSCFRHRTSFATVPRQCPEDGNVSEPARGGRRLRAPTRGPGGARRPIVPLLSRRHIAARCIGLLSGGPGRHVAGYGVSAWHPGSRRRVGTGAMGTPAEFFYSGKTCRRRPVGDTDAWARRGSNPRPAD